MREASEDDMGLADDLDYLMRKAQYQSLDHELCERVRRFIKALRGELDSPTDNV